MSVHRWFLEQALALAQRRKGFCWPNPAVGAVVVRGQQVLSEGYHYAAGCPHAEFNALTTLDYPLTGATLYITLQPCSHWGKTPPCVDEIVKSQVSQVVYACVDPDPRVKGFSLVDYLASKGIHCLHYEVPAISSFYAGYYHWHRTGKPWVNFKIAQSLNGKVGERSKRIKITQDDNLFKHTHQMRRSSDALLTTSKTVLVDRPAMNVRLDDKPIGKTVFVVDRLLDAVACYSQLIETCQQLVIFHEQNTLPPNIASEYIRFVTMPLDENGHLDFAEILTYIGHLGCHDVWIEAGATLLSGLLEKGQIQRLHVYISPILLADDALDSFVGRQSAAALKYDKVHWQVFGEEVMATIELPEQKREH